MPATIERTDDRPLLAPKDAERYCAAMARREAKNFYWGFIALPRPKRMAIYALYDFARQVDDEADRPRGERDPGRLTEHRARLRRCLDGEYADPVMQLLGHAVTRYQIPAVELEQLIAGVEMDLHHDRYQCWDDLQRYCFLVASTVGRMCVRIFGFRDHRALAFADDLGLAMQLTNILRDLREDYHRFGRIYLPLDDLAAYGLDADDLTGRLGPPPGQGDDAFAAAWGSVVACEVARARSLFASGLRVTDLIPTSSAACVLTMAGIYRGILDQIERDPMLPLNQRISLSGRSKLGVMAKSWLRSV